MDVATELGVPWYEWSVTTGLAKARGAPLYNTESPEQAVANIALIQGDGIFLLKDLRAIAITTKFAGGCGIWRRRFERCGARLCWRAQKWSWRRIWTVTAW